MKYVVVSRYKKSARKRKLGYSINCVFSRANTMGAVYEKIRQHKQLNGYIDSKIYEVKSCTV